MLKRGNRPSPRKGLRSGAWKLLSVLAISQLLVLGHRTSGRETRTQTVAIGDNLSSVVIKDSGGETIDLGAGHKTLLLVFDPDCPHTTRVADGWASWLDREESRAFRTIAVSPGALSAAVRYATDKHWKVRVGAVEPSTDGKGEHTLMKRTPWVFAVGSDGKVVAEGHGIRLDEVAQTIRMRSATDERAGPPATPGSAESTPLIQARHASPGRKLKKGRGSRARKPPWAHEGGRWKVPDRRVEPRA